MHSLELLRVELVMHLVLDHPAKALLAAKKRYLLSGSISVCRSIPVVRLCSTTGYKLKPLRGELHNPAFVDEELTPELHVDAAIAPSAHFENASLISEVSAGQMDIAERRDFLDSWKD